MLGNTTGRSMLLRAEPLALAEEISRRMVGVRVVHDALLLDADPAWGGAINTVLVKKGVKVDELIDCSRTNNASCCAVPSQKTEPGPRGTLRSRLEKWLRENPKVRRSAS